MDKKRAEAIVSAPVMIHVTYKGIPVCIDKVNSDDTAMIHFLDNPDDRQKVDVSGLAEQFE